MTTRASNRMVQWLRLRHSFRRRLLNDSCSRCPTNSPAECRPWRFCSRRSVAALANQFWAVVHPQHLDDGDHGLSTQPSAEPVGCVAGVVSPAESPRTARTLMRTLFRGLLASAGYSPVSQRGSRSASFGSVRSVCLGVLRVARMGRRWLRTCVDVTCMPRRQLRNTQGELGCADVQPLRLAAAGARTGSSRGGCKSIGSTARSMPYSSSLITQSVWAVEEVEDPPLRLADRPRFIRVTHLNETEIAGQSMRLNHQPCGDSHRWARTLGR